MSIDLKLLIVDGRIGTGGYSHTIIELGQWSEWLDRKLSKKARTIPGFTLNSYVARIPDGSWKDENGYGEVKQTPYGEDLTYVSAKEFVDAVGKEKWEGLGAAALAYVRALPPDTLIGLYYH